MVSGTVAYAYGPWENQPRPINKSSNFIDAAKYQKKISFAQGL